MPRPPLPADDTGGSRDRKVCLQWWTNEADLTTGKMVPARLGVNDGELVKGIAKASV
jgi:hypothetical protein